MSAPGEPGVIYRHGFAEPSTVRTTSGPAVIERPRVRDAGKVGFESRVVGKGVARTHALEALIICGFLRGLSVRDVEGALEECFGERVIGKSTVARVCRDTAERYAQWCQRDLAGHNLIYLYLDATVRHEALLNRAGWETPPLGCRSSPVKLRAVRPRSCGGWMGAALTTT